MDTLSNNKKEDGNPTLGSAAGPIPTDSYPQRAEEVDDKLEALTAELMIISNYFQAS